MRKLLIVGGGILVVAAAGFLVAASLGPTPQPAEAQVPDPAAPSPVLQISDTSSLPGPRQPIFFRHDIHAGQFKIQCQYCHYTVYEASEPGIPSVETCMGCHLVISGSDTASRAEIAKLRQTWADREPIEWVRIHALARHVHFPHSVHIDAMGPTACMTCHGDVTRMPQVYQVNNVQNMGFCITCHLERDASRDCTACHY